MSLFFPKIEAIYQQIKNKIIKTQFKIHEISFNLFRCLELMVNYNQYLQQGKTFFDYDEDKYNQLHQYFTRMSDYIFWKSRNRFLLIIQQFIIWQITHISIRS